MKRPNKIQKSSQKKKRKRIKIILNEARQIKRNIILQFQKGFQVQLQFSEVYGLQFVKFRDQLIISIGDGGITQFSRDLLSSMLIVDSTVKKSKKRKKGNKKMKRSKQRKREERFTFETLTCSWISSASLLALVLARCSP